MGKETLTKRLRKHLFPHLVISQILGVLGLFFFGSFLDWGPSGYVFGYIIGVLIAFMMATGISMG